MLGEELSQIFCDDKEICHQNVQFVTWHVKETTAELFATPQQNDGTGCFEGLKACTELLMKIALKRTHVQ